LSHPGVAMGIVLVEMAEMFISFGNGCFDGGHVNFTLSWNHCNISLFCPGPEDRDANFAASFPLKKTLSK